MNRRTLNMFTDVIARNLEGSYSSFMAEPAPPRLQTLLDQLDRAMSPEEAESPWVHYQQSDIGL